MPRKKQPINSGLDLFLRQWRKHRGLTQDQLVELSGIDKATISQLENRLVTMNERHLMSLGRALRCQPIDLLTWNPLEGDEPLSTLARRIPGGQQKLARTMLRALISNEPDAAAKAAREDAA